MCMNSMFFLLTRRPPRSTLFPCTTLFLSRRARLASGQHPRAQDDDGVRRLGPVVQAVSVQQGQRQQPRQQDRKSTRLNSSHANISYVVFCLKKNDTNSAD